MTPRCVGGLVVGPTCRWLIYQKSKAIGIQWEPNQLSYQLRKAVREIFPLSKQNKRTNIFIHTELVISFTPFFLGGGRHFFCLSTQYYRIAKSDILLPQKSKLGSNTILKWCFSSSFRIYEYQYKMVLHFIPENNNYTDSHDCKFYCFPKDLVKKKRLIYVIK